ncbi:phosphotransferase family protein [Chachezhania sediminis]|uniref:phosphotransferase family protein n=1 Tax=Chachezhania sediminis TaxID=2599291 RepID=UPI00131E30D9|nr:phosphotransferase family protein [Chachezhania sediminis]
MTVHHPPDRAVDPYDTAAVRTALERVLTDRAGYPVAVTHLRRFTVGFSWITYGFAAAGRALVLRIGPANGVFAPYRATPEALVLRSLAGHGIPVPVVHLWDEGPGPFGAPFLVVDLVQGQAPIPWTADGGPAFAEPEREILADQFLQALAALHEFDWQASEAGALDGTRDATRTAVAQIDAWENRMGEWSARRFPMLDWAIAWFRSTAPVAQRISLVHGDFRIGNFLERDGRITAILDWELVHPGDPMEDLGWICLQAWRGRSPHMCHLLTREDLADRYEALTGYHVDPKALAWWEAFGTFKLAVMHLGAAHCYEARGFNDTRMAGMGAQIPRLLLQLEAAVERAS